MDSPTGNKFSATDPALGYLYQVRTALLWSLKRIKIQPEFLVSIETIDDVTFEDTDGSPSELLQTKHHRKSTALLTDSSPDLWKTLRIWFEANSNKTILSRTSLVLVTTSVAKKDSAASFLKAEDRDVDSAILKLNEIASSSTNATNAAGYTAYLSSSNSERMALLERVIVIDGAPLISSLDDDLKSEIHWAAGKQNHDAFLERLEGWWYRRVLKQLMSNDDRVGSVELEAQMSDLREQFKIESLPIDDDLLDFILDDMTRESHAHSTFVHQLEIVKAGKRRVANSIRDYYRAFEQRSRWVRLDLVVELELSKYEKHLIEEWEIVFNAACDEIGDVATDHMKEEAARSVLAWAERKSFPIRHNVIEPFISRGSFHMLAEEVRLGWHPQFHEKLNDLLEGSGASS